MPYLAISRKNFLHNHKTILRSIASSNQAKVAIVLKDNAYGHGILEIAALAKEVNIQTAFVKNAQEALMVSDFFQEITILYPNSTPYQASLKSALKTPHITFCAPSLQSLKEYPPHTTIELKIDSGMHRNGIARTELKEALTILKSRNLNLKGVFTHNGYGDTLSSAFYTQNMEFLAIKNEVLELCQTFGIPRPRFHSLSSSGALRASNFNASLPKELQDDLFRIGIAFYGYNCGKIPYKEPLKPIAALFANQISMLHLPKGSNIGYSGISTLKEASTISTYDIGYGDGLFRLRDGMQLHTAEGYAILPNASMDCISIQSDAKTVCIFNDVRAFAEAFHTIPYEILAHLHPHIPRIIV